MNGLSNSRRDAVANTGHHRVLVLAVISIVVVAITAVFTTMHSPATIAATASSDWARADKIQCGFLSLRRLRFLWLKPRLLQEINPLASLA